MRRGTALQAAGSGDWWRLRGGLAMPLREVSTRAGGALRRGSVLHVVGGGGSGRWRLSGSLLVLPWGENTPEGHRAASGRSGGRWRLRGSLITLP